MFVQNITLACRTFKRNLSITSINILGLAIGICAALVIFLIIQYDYSFDKWEPDAERTYQVITETRPGQLRAAVPIPAPEAIKVSIPAIQTVTHFIEDPFNAPHITTSIQAPDNKTTPTGVHTNIKGIIFADQNYFRCFPHHWIAGKAASLNTLNSVVLTSSMAGRLFPGISAANTIGQTLTVQDSLTFKVTGIVADLHERTDFKAAVFLSMPSLLQTSLVNALLMPAAWYNLNGNSKCLIQLREGASLTQANQQIAALFKDHPFNIGDIKGYSAQLQPLSDIHFNMELGGKISKSTLLQLGLLATLLILLAIINYVNLATAMGVTRAKEIGVRKTFGGSKKQLLYQFLTETTLMTLLATVLALILMPFTLEAFKNFLPEGLHLRTIFSPLFIIFILILIVIVAVLSGFYPAYVLTKYRPALILKNRPGDGNNKKGSLRQILTVGQFVIAQVFLILVVLMGKQLSFVVNHDLGFDKEAIINFNLPHPSQTSTEEKNEFIQKLKHIQGISQISLSSGPPIQDSYNETAISWMQNGRKEHYYHTAFRTIDSNYLGLYNLQLLAGRNIRLDSLNAPPMVLINQSMMHHMGYTNPKDVIGVPLIGFYANSAVVTGVVTNFNTRSLHYSIQPTVLFADNFNNSAVISLKLTGGKPQKWAKTLTKLEPLFKSYYPNEVIKTDFFDQAIEALYETDIRTAKLLNWATGLAIFISLLGLLGLVSFMANRRIKEIAVRKVLGATTLQIILLLSKGLLKLVLIASVIAAPIALFFSSKWLQDFSYKTSISWWVFGSSAVGMLLIAMAVLWLRAIKTARLNPARSLKTE